MSLLVFANLVGKPFIHSNWESFSCLLCPSLQALPPRLSRGLFVKAKETAPGMFPCQGPCCICLEVCDADGTGMQYSRKMIHFAGALDLT